MPELTTLSIMGWEGLQQSDAPQRVQPQQAREASNVYYGNQGQVIRRDGYNIVTDSVDGMGEGRYLALFRSRAADKDYLIYVAHNDGDIYALDIGAGETEMILQTDTDSATVTLTSQANRLNYRKTHAVLSDYLFISDMTEAYAWDGSDHTADNDTWIKVTDINLTDNGTKSAPEFPHCRTLAVWSDRMIAGNCKVGAAGGTRRPSRIYFSGVLTPWKWGAGDYVDVNPDDGGEIQKIVVFGQSIIVFKDTAVYALVGQGGAPGDLSLYNVHSTIGCDAAGLSVAQSENTLFWFDPFRGVFSYDGAQVARLDDDLDDTLVSDVETGTAEQVAYGWFEDGRYYLSVNTAVGDVPDTTYVYDTRNGGWAIWTLGWRSVVRYGSLTYAVGLADAERGVGYILGGYPHDNGRDFAWSFETAWLPPLEQQGLEQWRLHRIKAWMRGTTPRVGESGHVSIRLWKDYLDTGDPPKTVVFDTEVGTSRQVLAIADFSGLPEMIDSFSLRFSSDQQEEMELYGITAVISTREQRRSVNE